MASWYSARIKPQQQHHPLRRACIAAAAVYFALLLVWSVSTIRTDNLRQRGWLQLRQHTTTAAAPSICKALPPSVWGDGGGTDGSRPQPTAEPPLASGAVHPAVRAAYLAVEAAAQAPHDTAAALWNGRQPVQAGACSSSSRWTRRCPGATAGGTPIIISLAARINVSALAAAAGPAFPEGSSSGRGVVMVGGGRKYTPPAYACIAFLRRSGCRLPVEVWAPPHEPITSGAAAELVALGGVAVRSLGDALPAGAAAAMQQHKFLAKPLAVLASAFREVLLLDADNLPLRDPAFLFDAEPYASTGLLAWPDFWPSQTQRGGWEALGIPRARRPLNSHESGQLVLDKLRGWVPLLLAAYLNMRAELFAPLLSTIGQGDKETWALAWLAARGNYSLVQHPVLALGTLMPDGRHAGSAMLQRGPDGLPLFLHAHMPKVDVPRVPPALPGTPGAPVRSWQVLTGKVAVPGRGNTSSHDALAAVAGFDVEAAVQGIRRHLHCRPAWVECCL